MRLRVLAPFFSTSLVLSGLLCSFLWLAGFVFAPSAMALTQIKLFNLSYHDCPSELSTGAVTSGGTALSASCYIVVGKAENTSGKPVYNANIYGRVYDANDEPIMQNRTRLGSIEEIPPGISDFELRISVPSNQPTPLKLEQFKASGFAARIRAAEPL